MRKPHEAVDGEIGDNAFVAMEAVAEIDPAAEIVGRPVFGECAELRRPRHLAEAKKFDVIRGRARAHIAERRAHTETVRPEYRD